MPTPSPQYAFAKNPQASIKRAVVRQLEERSGNPRVTWRALTTSAGTGSSEGMSVEQFAAALKGLGTGIQVTAGDVEIALGGKCEGGVVSFAMFRAFLEEN